MNSLSGWFQKLGMDDVWAGGMLPTSGHEGPFLEHVVVPGHVISLGQGREWVGTGVARKLRNREPGHEGMDGITVAEAVLDGM